MKFVIALCCLSLLWISVRGEEIPKPPKMTFHPEGFYYFFDSDVMPTWTCAAEGSKTITYEWRWKKTSGGAWETIVSNEFRTVTEGTLVLTVPTVRDEGAYQCLASNAHGTALSKIIIVRKATIDSFDRSQPSRTTYATVGGYKEIKCRNPPKAVPTPVYYWHKGVKPNSAQTQLEGKEYAVDPTGTLHMLKVKEDDFFNKSERYLVCQHFNRVSRGGFLGSTTILELDRLGKAQTSRPIKFVYFTNKKLRVEMDMGVNVTLMCIADGSPNIPDILWKRGGKDIGTIESFAGRYTLEEKGRRLLITSVQEEDEGVYECYVKQKPELSEKRVIEVASKPIKVHVPEDQILLNGDTKTFTCEGRSANKHSQVSIKWFEGTREITNQFPKFTVEGSRLTFKNAQKPIDIKSLACVMTNDYGTRYFSFGVNIIQDTRITQRSVVITNHTKDGVENKKPLVFHLSERGRTVVVTDDITIDMMITAEVDSLVKKDLKRIWKRNGKEIKSRDPSSAVYMELYHVILNSTTKQKDRIDELVGNYTCEIDVGVDSAKKVLVINFVKQIIPIVVPVVAQAGFPFWVLGLILGLLLLILVITLIICVMYRNRGGIWKVDEKEREAGNNIEKELADSGFHDLGRADGPDEEKKPIDQRSLSDDDPPPGEDTASLDEYGEPDMSKFNEEGSFIDMYGQTRSRNEPTQRPNSLNYGPEDQQTLTDNVTPPPSYYPPIPPNNRHTNRSFTNDTMV